IYTIYTLRTCLLRVESHIFHCLPQPFVACPSFAGSLLQVLITFKAMDFHCRVLNVLAISFTLCAISSSFDMSITSLQEGRGEQNFLRSLEEVKWLYEEWLVTHDKSYNMPREKERRFEIFKKNLHFIDEHNRPEHNHSYAVGLNRFADLTNEEFTSFYLSSYANMSEQLSLPVSDRYVYKDGDQLPDYADWRSEGAVGPVKDQGRCKSCWAFSAVAAIEGINYIISEQLITLSEQQILDCEMLDIGCGKPGRAQDAYEFVMMNGGISTDEIYPYRRRKEKCKWNTGIFDGACGSRMRHNMVVVGYDSEDGKDYWIVKNSWGNEWGEAGYIRMERNVDDPAGKCGITTYASYPLIMCPID
ncbi:hypothetical protein Taro_005990, partial [Colocasia esculenta]|nr:hypothetical protein [Colocasia esculenta]